MYENLLSWCQNTAVSSSPDLYASTTSSTSAAPVYVRVPRQVEMTESYQRRNYWYTTTDGTANVWQYKSRRPIREEPEEAFTDDELNEFLGFEDGGE